MRRGMWITVSLFLLMMITACNTGNPSANSGTNASASPFNSNTTNASNVTDDRSDEIIEITFWSQREELYADMVTEFERLHPHIKVNAQHVGNDYDEMAQRVMAGAMGNNLPNVVQMGQRHGIAQMADSGQMIPIDQFMSQEEIDDVLPAFWERFKYKGSLWTIPFESSTPVMYYNKTMLDKKGLQPPDTWDELVEVAKQLTDHDAGIWGFNTAEDIPWYIQPMVWNRGGTIVDADGNVSINNPEVIETLQSLYDLIHLHQVMPPNQLKSSGEDFAAGRLGILFRSGASLRSIKNQVGDSFEVGVAFLPQVESRNVPIGGNSLGIFKSDEKTEQASWEFVKFMTNPENSARRSMETGYIPVRHTSYELDFFQEHLENDPDFKVAIDQSVYLKGQSINPADAMIWLELVQIVEKMASNPTIDPQQLAEQLEIDVHEYLQHYGK